MFSPFLNKLKNFVSQPELTFRERAKLNGATPNEPIKDYPLASLSTEDMKNYIYDLVRTIRDPEKPYNLEDLNIVYENGIEVTKNDNSVFLIKIEFTPTISHCSLATLIGLCIRVKLMKHIQAKHKLTIRLKEGSHITEDAVNKQINDKERVAAAIENPSLQTLVNKCTEEEN